MRINLPWLHKDTPEEAEARKKALREREELEFRAIANRQDEIKRQEKDLQTLARGGIPFQAVERLREIGESGDAIFTSDLAPEEAGLMRRAGYRPLGLVTGSAIYHVGQAYASAFDDCEVRVISDAYDSCTELAVGRLRQELQLIGAHGVVGVRIQLVRHEWADKTIEVQVIGTAVEGPGAPTKDPWMCDLSGQEWYALNRAGYQPVGLVWGHSTWFVLNTWMDEQLVTSWQNVELSHWSAALHHARNRAMDTVRMQTKQHNGTGVAGVKIIRRLDEVRLSGGEGDVYEREHHNLVISVIGTAIRPIPNAPTQVRATQIVLSLREGRLSPVQIDAADLAVE